MGRNARLCSVVMFERLAGRHVLENLTRRSYAVKRASKLRPISYQTHMVAAISNLHFIFWPMHVGWNEWSDSPLFALCVARWKELHPGWSVDIWSLARVRELLGLHLPSIAALFDGLEP